MTGYAPPIPSPNAAVLSEEDRQAARREIHQREAEIEIVRQHVELLRRQLIDLDQRSDQRVADHQAACGPLQSRLTEVEAELASAIVERRAGSPELESERVDLIASISGSNESLERDLQPLKAARLKIEREIQSLQMQVAAGTGLLNKLSLLPLANRDLWTKKFAAQEAESWAMRRVQAAEGQLTEARDRLARVEAAGSEFSHWSLGGHQINKNVDSEELALAKLRVAKWTAEAAAAREAAAEAKAALAAAHAALLAE